MADLNQLKDQIDFHNKKYIGQIKEIEKDGSEKAEKLSIYFDEELAKVNPFKDLKILD